MNAEHDHESFTHCCPVCGLAPRQVQPAEAWGFEKRTCTVCGQERGGNPYRLCHCQMREQGLKEQPHVKEAMKNNNCDNDKCRSATGEVRVLPTGGEGNAILCRACFDYELRFRRERNRFLAKDCQFKLPEWESLKVYTL